MSGEAKPAAPTPTGGRSSNATAAPGASGVGGRLGDALVTAAAKAPWWLVILVVGLIAVGVYVAGSHDAQVTLQVLRRGMRVTITVTLTSFALALVLGLVAGLGRVSRRRWARELSTLYVEVVRGVPMLVVLLWFGFAFAPWIVTQLRDVVMGWSAAGTRAFGIVPWLVGIVEPCSKPSKCLSMEMRGILGLAFGYGAYVAEIVRSGVQAVGRGQTEAALSLGMTRRQSLQYVILPQALQIALPPLGNDFIALLKDSSLISVLAVADIVYVARQHVSNTLQTMQVFNLMAVVYLVLTMVLSFGVRWIEGRAEWTRIGRGT
ncbi:MAG: amino acid ABC transporter permease [Ardenticatenales bacterium]